MPVGKVYRIGFVGAHSAGKDTLTSHAKTYLKIKKQTCYLIDEQAEQALMQKKDLAMPANQFWLIAKQIQLECEAIDFQKRKFVICNRTVLDGIAYSHVLINEWFADRLYKLALAYLHSFNYDLIIYLKPLPEIDDDGVRMTDKAQQAEIAKQFDYYLRQMRKQTNFDYVEINDDNKPARIKSLELILDTWLEIWQSEKHA